MTDRCYSLNDEEYRYTELGELFDAMDSEGIFEVGQIYYEMACEIVTPEEFIHVDLVLDSANDDAWSELGECAEDMFDASKEAVDELAALLTEWTRKHITGTYWRCVGKAIEHTVTEEDVRSVRGDVS